MTPTDNKHAALRERLITVLGQLPAFGLDARRTDLIAMPLHEAIAALTPAPATSGTDATVIGILADCFYATGGAKPIMNHEEAANRILALLPTTPTPVAAADDEAGRKLLEASIILRDTKWFVAEPAPETWGRIWPRFMRAVEVAQARAAMAQGGNNE